MKLPLFFLKKKLLFFFLFITITCCKLNAQYTVTFGENYPPYNFINDEGELVGFNIDIINAIRKTYPETEIQLNSDNWKAINKELDSGLVQAIGGAHYPDTYDNDYKYSRSTINTSHCFFYNSKHYINLSLEKIRSIKNPLVVIWKNDVLIHYVLSINPSAKFKFIKNYDEFIKIVDREDITCFFGQRIGVMYYAEKHDIDYIEPLDHRILERNMGFKISKNTPVLEDIINNGLEIIYSNGTYEKIHKKWIAKYQKHPFDWRNYIKYIIFIIALFLFLLIVNWFLQLQVRKRTKDLRLQIEVNAEIMQELEIQKFKAEESDRMKSAFLANMSHEIRTPMNGILGFTELLKTTDYSSEKQAKFINIIQQSGNRMLNTINSIIDISKLESGLERVYIKPINVETTINELVDFFTPEATAKGLFLTLEKNEVDSDILFYTDEYKLNAILTNLIKNALKFTSKGGIVINYRVTQNYIEFWVKDTGIGIHVDKQASIFDEFVQADYSHSSGYEGSGLGLSISKGYVALLNGNIALESVPNTGSTFHFRIPNSSTENAKKEKVKEIKTTNKKTSIKYNIIIAEDDKTTFYFLKEILKDITESLHHAKNGKEVVALAKQHPNTDLILMDIKMPYLNGFEATRKIRLFNKDVYIIGHTAFAQENYKRKVIEVGCNAYIAKPINKEKLFSLIQEIKIK